MKNELTIISDDLNHGIIDEKEARKLLLILLNAVELSEKCIGCKESNGETKLWCCNHCGKRIEDF